MCCVLLLQLYSVDGAQRWFPRAEVEKELSDGIVSEDDVPAAPFTMRLRQRRGGSPDTPRVSAMHASLEAAVARHGELLRAGAGYADSAETSHVGASSPPAGGALAEHAHTGVHVVAAEGGTGAVAGSKEQDEQGTGGASEVGRGQRPDAVQGTSSTASTAQPAGLDVESVPAGKSAAAPGAGVATGLGNLTEEQVAELQTIGAQPQAGARPWQLRSHAWQPTCRLFSAQHVDAASDPAVTLAGRSGAVHVSDGLTWEQTRQLQGISAGGLEQYASLRMPLWRPPALDSEGKQDLALPSERSGYCTERSSTDSGKDSGVANRHGSVDVGNGMSGSALAGKSRARQQSEATRRRLLESDTSSSSDGDESAHEQRALDLLSESLRTRSLAAAANALS
jgi:hypothetical protein